MNLPGMIGREVGFSDIGHELYMAVLPLMHAKILAQKFEFPTSYSICSQISKYTEKTDICEEKRFEITVSLIKKNYKFMFYISRVIPM